MPLEIGAPAPDFSLQNQHGQTVSLAGFRGNKSVVLVFYPFAFSGVCTGELHELRDQLGDFSNERSELLAVSCDHMFSQRAYADRDGYAFSLLSDHWPHGAVSAAYGIFNHQAGCSGRATFIIDRNGILRWQVENAISDARDIDAYRKVLAEIG